MKKIWLFILVFLVIMVTALLLFQRPIATFLADLYWWESVGYIAVFNKIFLLQLATFIAPFLTSFLFLLIWFFLIRRVKASLGVVLCFLAVSTTLGVWSAIRWEILLPNFSDIRFGISDPFLGLDASFYMIRQPLLRLSLQLVGGLFASFFILDLLLYRKKNREKEEAYRVYFSPARLLLLTVVFTCAALLFSSHVMENLAVGAHPKLGIGFGEFYGHILGSAIWLGLVILVYLLWIILSLRGLKLATIFWNTAVLVFLYFAATVWYPEILKGAYVLPNELMVQQKFIDYRKNMTRYAYGLDFKRVSLSQNPVRETNFMSLLEKLRIWDAEPYLKVIRQIQQMKNYFDFYDVDVDVYDIPHPLDTNRLESVQVLLSARELNSSKLPDSAISWDNLHLRYTHGHGVVISPAHLVNREGGPVFWLEGLGADAVYSNLNPLYPQIYFGELTSNYVIVRTTTPEFEYTISTNRYTKTYEADRGILLDSFWKKLVFSVAFGERNILITQYLTEDSRILFNRQIMERVRKIFPYLHYDADPYIAIVEGRLVWIIDAFTVSDRFPLSQRKNTDFGSLNYIRNSVKVTIDAYSGDTLYYVVDKTDPIIQSYSALFPELLTNRTPSAELNKHFRYSHNLAKIQSDILLTYHVENSDSFYNSDDEWEIPKHLWGDSVTNFDPYYLLEPTHAVHESRFAVVQPFVPQKRDNLAGWLDAYYENGPKLTLYHADDKMSVFGPMQIESKINQDNILATLFTLWGQKGSKVYRGKIKFIPAGNKILYVEPIFIESEATGMPQLARIVSVYDNALYIGTNYTDLVEKMTNERPALTLTIADLEKGADSLPSITTNTPVLESTPTNRALSNE